MVSDEDDYGEYGEGVMMASELVVMATMARRMEMVLMLMANVKLVIMAQL